MEITFDRYDQDARLAVFHACILATHRRRSEISVEELLLGLTWRQHASDCEFRKLKLDAEKSWEAVGMPHLPLSELPYEPSAIPLGQEAKKVFKLTLSEANREGDYWIDVDHMLCAILRHEGKAAAALRDVGWSIERIKTAGARGRLKYPPKPVPRSRRISFWWITHRPGRREP